MFDELISEALKQDFSGWDFSWLDGRWQENDPTWDYSQLVKEKIVGIDSLLDMDTGGGEFMASLGKLPPNTSATESYPPNIIVARQRLEPLGVNVVTPENDKTLPFPDNSFDLIINRHGAFWSPEIYRILKPGGTFITQQVGESNLIQINQSLQDEVKLEYGDWTLKRAINELENAGLQITRQQEEFPDSIFYDIGAVVFYLKVIQWQIEDFTVDKYRQRLLSLHNQIQKDGQFAGKSHRFYVEARK